MSIEVQFLTTSGCHLCDKALRLIKRSPVASMVKLESIDIADSATLIEEYGMRIPVLKAVVSGHELGWPFDEDEYQQWIESLLNK